MFDRVRCPTRVVRGEFSDLLSAEVAQAMTARGPHPDLVQVPGVGHAPMFMDEAQIAIAREFLRPIDRSPDRCSVTRASCRSESSAGAAFAGDEKVVDLYDAPRRTTAKTR